MQPSVLVVLGVARLAMAQGAAGFPACVGDFEAVGCRGGSLSEFQLTASSDCMTLNLCAASCPSKYFGTVNK